MSDNPSQDLSIEEKFVVLEALEATPKQVEIDKKAYSGACFGICTYFRYNLDTMFENLSYLEREKYLRYMQNIFQFWPKYSGNKDFPIPVPSTDNFFTKNGVVTVVMPEFFYHITRDKWEGEYGELRKELLQFCIEYTLKDIRNYLDKLNKS